MYDVSRVEPKQIANGRFESADGVTLGEVTGLRINSNGTYIAILSSQLLHDGGLQHGAPTKTPDTAVYVYSVDADKIYKYDSHGRRYPVFAWWDSFEHRLLAVQTERMKVVATSSPAAAGVGAGVGEAKEAEEKEVEDVSLIEPHDEPDTELMTLFISADADVGLTTFSF